MVADGIARKMESSFTSSSFGLVLAVMGSARLRQRRRIMKNEVSLRARENRETDEKNVMLVNKPRSLAFPLYVLLSCAAAIVLSLFGLHDYAPMAAFLVCLLVAVCCGSHLIFKKKR